jgi:SNF2 family DNA or RNA helicase
MLGGILADDMGLGKTLTMVAAIASSVSDAESYANDMLQNTEMTQAAGKIPAKSTLVIVPSPCK